MVITPYLLYLFFERTVWLLWANETLKRAFDFRKADGLSCCPSHLLTPIIGDDDDNDNSIQFNSIQFNSYLFTRKLKGPGANYKVNTSKKKATTTKHY
jgi:hypothetical protein